VDGGGREALDASGGDGGGVDGRGEGAKQRQHVLLVQLQGLHGPHHGGLVGCVAHV